MPISPDLYQPLDDAINRLATESILAQAGRDDGVVPSYCLLGELCEMCAGEPALEEPLTAFRAEMEKLLDAAQPFDDATLNNLRRLVSWLPLALGRSKAGEPIPNSGASPAAVAPSQPLAQPPPAVGTGDRMLEMNLGENGELFAEFYAETVDHLQQIEAALLALDQQPENPEALASIFRSFHTIKGNAGFLQLVPMHTLAHEIESLLDLARNNKLRLSTPIISEILRGRDALQALTAQVGATLQRGQLPSEIIPVSHLIAAIKVLAAQAVAAPEASSSGAGAPIPFPTPATAPAVAHAPVAIVEIPAAQPAEAATAAWFPAPGPPPAAPGAAPISAMVAAAVAPKKSAPPPAAGKAGSSSATVRVNTEKLDNLMDVVGELVIVQSQLMESSRPKTIDHAALQRNVAHLSRITKELQSTAMALRMIPIKQTFQKMERLVRDLARDLGKKVTFVTSGEDTELDRTVVEEIGDPLVHMVRNALDHGLETTADRIATGKPEVAQVDLRAYHEGSNIVIELQDDGRGIDPDKIYRKAVEKGLVPPGAPLSREEILGLLFAPGFSTAEKITAVSGRGVGLDVVKRNIENLRGKIEISSELRKGSIFKIKLPLTMAIIDGLIVRVGQDRFILPSTSVKMALRPARDAISTIQGRGEVLDLRGRFVPIHRLHRRFGLAHEASNPWEGIVVIIENAGRTSALLVDEMVSKQEVVIKNLGAFMQNVAGVSGAAILGDGNIALILDPASLLNAA